MAQYSFTDFVKTNIAPKEAKYIGVYNNAGNRVGEIPLGELENTNGTPLYKFGILSDIHVDTTENSSNGRVQFQTSSSYGGGTITIFMKVKVNFTQ